MRQTKTVHLQRGSTLVAVLWIMAVMSLALVATVKITSYQTDVAGSQMNGIDARQYADMGLNLASNPAVEEWDPILNWIDPETGNSGFNVKILSEGARFNINFILFSEDKALIRLILDEWGIDFDTSSEIADALIDWIDTNDDVQLNGAEVEYYEGQGYLDRPFNRPFYNLDEMRLVRGMDIVEAANPNWRDWFTCWSSGGLDINEADARLIAVATESNIEEAIALVDIVDGPDGIRNTEDDQPIDVASALAQLGVVDPTGVIQARLNANDQVSRIESIGFVGAIRRKLVLVLNNRRQNPTILDRREETIQ
ncbi:MAG: general secretion pathway protein GspK [Akkermansiaceae bacterium]